MVDTSRAESYSDGRSSDIIVTRAGFSVILSICTIVIVVLRSLLRCLGTVVILRRTFDRLASLVVILPIIIIPRAGLNLTIVVRNILLCGWTVGGRGITAARVTGKVFCGCLRNVLPRRCAASVLSVIIAVAIIGIVIDRGRRCRRLIWYIAISTLDVIIVSLIIRVIIRLVIGAGLQGRGLYKLSSIIVILVILVVAGRFHCCALTEAASVLLIIISVVSIVNSCPRCRTRGLEIVILLIVCARPVRRRRRVVSLRILIPVIILLRPRAGRWDKTVGPLIVIAATVETSVSVLIAGSRRSWCTGRCVIAIAIVIKLLLPADLPNPRLLLGVLNNLLFVGLLALIILLLAVSVIIKVTTAATTQVPVVIRVVTSGGHSVEGVGRGADRIAGFAAL